MIVYLGQSVRCTQSLSSPAVVTGFAASGIPLISRLKFDGTISKDETVHKDFLKPLKHKTKNSPSGYSLYMGPFCRNVSPKGPISMKMPSDAELVTEFAKIKELIKENDKEDDND